MIRRFTLIMLMLLLPALSRAQTTEDYRFKGQVVDTAGKAVGSVHVTMRNLADGSRISFTTKDDGSFDRRMIPSAQYETTFEKEGFVMRTEKFDWSASQEETKTVEAKIVLESKASKAQSTEQEMSKEGAALYEKAYAAMQANDCTQATANARALLKVGAGGREYAARFIIARCAASGQKFDEAEAEYKRAIALKPDFFEARFDLAQVLEKLNKHDEAIQEYQQAVALKPQSAEAQYNLGALLLQKNQFDNARPHLEAALAADSTNANAARALGFACLQGEKKDMKAAKANLERYLALKPDAPDAADIRAVIAELKPTP
jgi:tetratricopeptide (TPR) repeat protein